MIIKQSLFRGADNDGIYFHLLHAGYSNSSLIKTAAEDRSAIAEIDAVTKSLPRGPGNILALVSAMGASEYWDQNSNGDIFPERALIHTPPDWANLPVWKRPSVGRSWEWGYPTFHNAHAYQHHVNKDPARAFGDVVYATWDSLMKRVLLVVSIDRKRAEQMGATAVCDRIDNGEFSDVSMGCFTAGTLVTMGDGTRKSIEDVVVGDEVITHLGRKRKVTKVHQRKYKGDLYSIKPEAHSVIRCTRQHPFLAVPFEGAKERRGSGWVWREKGLLATEWVHAECLNDQLLIEPVLQKGSCDKTPSRALARLLGYYLAEGHLIRNRKGALAGIELTAHRDDVIHDEIERLCKELETKNAPSSKKRTNSEFAVGISIFDKALAAKMLRLAGVYSKEKRLHEEVLTWPTGALLEMLGAYINGDGCSYNGSLRISTASADLAHQFAHILPRLGIISSLSCVQHRAGSGFSAQNTYEYVTHIGKQWAPILKPYCQKLEVKEVFKAKNSRKFFADQITTPVRDIFAIYVETDVFNLEVDEDESYLVEGLAVHNCRVPFDLCSYCTDWSRITGNPKVDLVNHRRNAIRGLSETTKDYCSHLKRDNGKVYPNGVRIGMVNLHPKFFDISFVFIGADKTSKVMAKLAGACPIRPGKAACGNCTDCVSSAHVYEVWDGKEKAASVNDEQLIKEAFAPGDSYTSAKEEKELSRYFKSWKNKRAEIEKRVKSNLEPMLPRIGDREEDLPEDVLEEIADQPADGMATAGSLGIVLKPREFQRTMLISLGKRDVADQLDDRGLCFRPGEPPTASRHIGDVLPSILRRLIPAVRARSAFGPPFHKRIIITIESDGGRGLRGPIKQAGFEIEGLDSLFSQLSSEYSAYRRELITKVAELAKNVISDQPQVLGEFFPGGLEQSFEGGIAKTSVDMMQSLIGMMPTMYINGAYLDEPVSEYVSAHSDYNGIVAAGVLSARGRVA